MVQCEQPETVEARAERYDRAFRAIARCTLTGVDFGDYVQALCEDVLDGGEAECPECGTMAHDGPCVSEDVDSAAAEKEAGAAESTADRGFPINTQ